MIEVEAKYLVTNVGEFEQAALRWGGGNPALEYRQCDEYFNHPCRDFDQTDEAIRIRSCNGQIELTYKGPRLDTITKTREELELEIPSTNSGQSNSVLRSLLIVLGFTPAGCVKKVRRSFEGAAGGFPVTISMDAVEGLPPYAEIEITCESAQRGAATELVLQLAEAFGLTLSERRSYLELLGY